MPTAKLRPERISAFYDKDGVLSWHKDQDSVESYTLDWADFLGADTISTSSWEADGIAVDSDSNTTTTTEVTVSKTGGTAKNTITTAGGYTYVRRVRFYEAEL